MAVTTAQIQGIAASQPMRNILTDLNNSVATAVTIGATQISIQEKMACLDVLNSVATRASINAYEIPLPVKAILLSIAGV